MADEFASDFTKVLQNLTNQINTMQVQKAITGAQSTLKDLQFADLSDQEKRANMEGVIRNLTGEMITRGVDSDKIKLLLNSFGVTDKQPNYPNTIDELMIDARLTNDPKKLKIATDMQAKKDAQHIEDQANIDKRSANSLAAAMGRFGQKLDYTKTADAYNNAAKFVDNKNYGPLANSYKAGKETLAFLQGDPEKMSRLNEVIAQYKLARQTQGGGVLTEQDFQHVNSDPTWRAQAAAFYNELFSNRAVPSRIEEIQKLATSKLAQDRSRLLTAGSNFAKGIAKSTGVPLGDVQDQIFLQIDAPELQSAAAQQAGGLQAGGNQVTNTQQGYMVQQPGVVAPFQPAAPARSLIKNIAIPTGN